MKWRVILAALFVLTLFAVFAYFYVNTFVRKHQHAVILFVVDGLDLNTLSLSRQHLGRGATLMEPDDPAIGDARRRVAYRSEMLSVDSLWNVAILNVQDPGRPVPDEGADATALACGVRVDNGFVAMNARNEALRSLIYVAEQAQRATGLVTTSSLTRPTAVAFYSTTKGASEPYRNAEDLIYSDIDVIMGGGGQYFTPATTANERGRIDGRNLLSEAASRGYSLVRTRADLDRLSTWRRQILGVFAPGDFYYSALQPPHSSQPSLTEMTQMAISSLNRNINGYFLVVVPGLVSRAAEENLGQLAQSEVAEVDDAIAAAVEYAGPDALVLVTNNYSLGAVAGVSSPPAGPPDLPPTTRTVVRFTSAPQIPPPPLPVGPPSWLVGPGGPAVTQSDQTWLARQYAEGSFSTNAPGLLQPQAAFRFQVRGIPDGEPAWLASRGEGAQQLRGFFNNTDVFDIVSEQF
jgi:alkaline phosphatase